MGVSNLWFLHGVVFSGGQFLSELTDLSPATNIDELTGYAAGHPDPLFLAARAIKPHLQFDTPQLKTILDLCGTAFIADLSGGNTDLHYKLAANRGVRAAAASAVHQRLRMATGAMYWEEVSAAHQQDATLKAKIVPTYNGTNAPIVPAGTLALAGVPAAAEFYTLGPVLINGAELAGIKSVRIALSPEVIEESAGGDVYPTFFAIGQRQPVIEITSLEAGAWVSFGLDGTALNGSTGAVCYLRKKTADGTNSATAAIAFTALNGRIQLVQSSGGGNKPSETRLRIPARALDSTVAAITVNTSLAIP
jgi:hypothetical protein